MPQGIARHDRVRTGDRFEVRRRAGLLGLDAGRGEFLAPPSALGLLASYWHERSVADGLSAIGKRAAGSFAWAELASIIPRLLAIGVLQRLSSPERRGDQQKATARQSRADLGGPEPLVVSLLSTAREAEWRRECFCPVAALLIPHLQLVEVPAAELNRRFFTAANRDAWGREYGLDFSALAVADGSARGGFRALASVVARWPALSKRLPAPEWSPAGCAAYDAEVEFEALRSGIAGGLTIDTAALLPNGISVARDECRRWVALLRPLPIDAGAQLRARVRMSAAGAEVTLVVAD